jgi:hypothetical protein
MYFHEKILKMSQSVYRIPKNRASLVWPKLVWPKAHLAKTHLAELTQLAENFTKMD